MTDDEFRSDLVAKLAQLESVMLRMEKKFNRWIKRKHQHLRKLDQLIDDEASANWWKRGEEPPY